MSTDQQSAALHLGIAEQGKVHALEGNHKEALRHYREALRMAMEQKAGDVFFQHYTQCVMESLELTGAHEEVIAYCNKMHAFLDGQPQEVAAVKQNKAAVLEREAIQYLYQEESQMAKDCLSEAQRIMGRGKQSLTDQLLGWVSRGFKISQRQLKQAQQHSRYFIVRADKVDPSRAIALPPSASPF